jgi:hypothetical protein
MCVNKHKHALVPKKCIKQKANTNVTSDRNRNIKIIGYTFDCFRVGVVQEISEQQRCFHDKL